jgi:SAM-dependent methyltransferase
MMKMFHPAEAAGDARFWEAVWNDGQLAEAIRFCEVDPLRPLFEKYVTAGTRLLEGGCGRGQYVVYYSGLGVRVTGVDFARAAIARLKSRHPTARVCIGDVSALPFLAGSHDAYYSGGVVEHFESGPLPALREARRVLREGGVLLVSVPYLSPLRRLSVLWRRDRRLLPAPTTGADVRRQAFWQYAFGVREFGGLLEHEGFDVVRTHPYAIIFGLYDLPFVQGLIERRRNIGLPPCDRGTGVQPAAASDRVSLLKRLLVAEDRSLPGLGLMIEVAGRLCANMMMYVCVRSSR